MLFSFSKFVIVCDTYVSTLEEWEGLIHKLGEQDKLDKSDAQENKFALPTALSRQLPLVFVFIVSSFQHSNDLNLQSYQTFESFLYFMSQRSRFSVQGMNWGSNRRKNIIKRFAALRTLFFLCCFYEKCCRNKKNVLFIMFRVRLNKFNNISRIDFSLFRACDFYFYSTYKHSTFKLIWKTIVQHSAI